MTITFEQVKEAIEGDEPDYEQAANLGVDALQHLASIIKGNDPLFAPRAAYLVSLIPSIRSIDILRDAAKSNEVLIRIAVAAALRNITSLADDSKDRVGQILSILEKDEDDGVRKQAIKSNDIRE